MKYYDIILTGWLGARKSLELLAENRERLSRIYSRDYLETGRKQLETAVGAGNLTDDSQTDAFSAADNAAGICEAMKLGAEGLYGGLWELGERLDTGLFVYYERIRIKQFTIELGEFFDFDPLSMDASGNSLLLTEDAFGTIWRLQEAGITAAWIGRTQETLDRVILNGERKRFLTPSKRL